MLKQNSDVELYLKSTNKGGIINVKNEELINSGLIWLYALVGLGITYAISRYRRKNI